MKRWLALVVALAFASTVFGAEPPCTDAVATTRFAGADELRAWHQVMADLGPRPTAGPAHRRYVRWLRKQLRSVPGLRIAADRFPIAPRQLERGGSLRVIDAGGVAHGVPIAGPIPYTRLTSGRGIEAPIVRLAAGQAITAASAAGRIVVRERAVVGVPYRILQQAATLWYDPQHTLDLDAPYERETLSRQTLDDVRAAQTAGAAGLVMVEPFPRAQIAGQYQPYRGEVWNLPGVVLGADEGAALLAMLAAGAPRAVIGVHGTQRRAVTMNLVATLPGSGSRKIVVASHTDGMNPIWDNGPLAMLALVRHFAALPASCRPATLEFAFTSAHLYLSEQGADRYAERLLAERGAIAAVVVLEHLGAAEFAAVPRPDGPGRMLVPTGAPELTFVFATPASTLLAAATSAITAHDLQRTTVIPFTAGIANGEGKSYDERGFPTIAAIASPWTLRNPAFGIETVDVVAMREMTLAFRDVLVALQDPPPAP